jgi:small-conductance mechanosensitive channel
MPVNVMDQTIPVSTIAHLIQLAIAPVFLLTAVGTIINALMGRLARAVDRRRVIEDIIDATEGDRRANLLRELDLIARRTVLVLWSIGLAVFCALLVCLLIGTAFVGAFLLLDLSRTVALLFIVAVVALTGCLLLFMREVFLAALSVHQTVWPQPTFPERK